MMNNNTIAIYPGTFDPVTNGHLDLIQRAARLFDQIIIGVAYSPTKKPLFTLDERVELVKKSIAGIQNVSVVGFSGLLIDLAKAQNATVLLRGLRTTFDFEYELQLANANKTLYPNLESIFLPTAQNTACISSSLVKEIAIHNGNVSNFVNDEVSHALKAKLANDIS